MKTLRRWQLSPTDPYALRLAADGRLSQTDYLDDQVWEVAIGQGDEPALALHTKYGSRVGLASLVPMWLHANRVIYQAQTYVQPPQITVFTPGYIAAEAKILPQLSLTAEHIALDSHTLGALYTLHNSSDQAISLRMELFAQVGMMGKPQKLAVVTIAEGGHALSLGNLDRLAPVVIIENGGVSSNPGSATSPKIGVDVMVPARGEARIRWVHNGTPEIFRSLNTAQRWLAQDWQPMLLSIEAAAHAIPRIETGNAAWDAVIASSYNQAVQSLLRPAGIFPYATLVSGRLPELGFSRRGTGSDHPRMWEGQDAHLALMLLPALAGIAPAMAEGVLRNYLAMQQNDGFIDMKPGAGGNKTGLLCPPVLASAAWAIYQETENSNFLEEIFDGLRRFFAYWLAQDADGDGVPEWQDDRQTGYAAFPMFAPGRDWAQGAFIRTAETPDLLAYLLAEAEALQQIATTIREKDAKKEYFAHEKDLRKKLADFWEGDYYATRDRDTDITTTGMTLLEEGQGDLEHLLNQSLAAPNRLIVRIVGGVKHVPTVHLTVEGLDRDGNAITETARSEQFVWQNRNGVYTTDAVFSQVNRVFCEGLSRVYTITVTSMDTTGLDINALMPLWAGGLRKAQRTKLAELALSEQFLRPNGITMTSTTGDHFDPSNAEGAGGVWMYWQHLLGQGLLQAGYPEEAAKIALRVLDLLSAVLREQHQFAQFYHSDEPIALSERGHTSGIAPLHFLNALFGIRIHSTGHVWISKGFAWGQAITIVQHGVRVMRNSDTISVDFPSGHGVKLEAPLEKDQRIEDPDAAEALSFAEIKLAQAPAPHTANSPEAAENVEAPSAPRIIIEVEREE